VRDRLSRFPKDRRRRILVAVDYEVTYIFRPNLEEGDVTEKSGAIASQLKENGGEVLGVEALGKKRLAYEINDVREGIYVVMRFRSDAAAAHELERQLGLNEDVMRALLVRLDKQALEAEKAAPVPVAAGASAAAPAAELPPSF
jgi:small subunit ribosomal protein S6